MEGRGWLRPAGAVGFGGMNFEDRISKSLQYLVETDESAAELKAEMMAAEQQYKATIDAHFLVLDGSIEQRKAEARQKAEPIYGDFLNCVEAYEKVANKRKTESIVIDALRTLCANRRQGANIQ